VPTVDERVARLEEVIQTMDTALKHHFVEFRAFVVETLAGVEKRLTTRLDVVDKRLDRVEGRLDELDKRLDRVEGRLDELDKRLDRVEGRLDVVEKRLDGIDAKLDILISRVPRRPRVVRKRRQRRR
jgi:chromosome segregation ATPase